MPRHATEPPNRNKEEMEKPKDPLPLTMVRENLEQIPEFPLPVGFELRWYEIGDEKKWLRIHVAADRLNRITPELFAQQFGSDSNLLGQRQCYLLSENQPIGTATAWFNDNFEGKRYGRVHWVAILPQFQGRGLSKPLMTTICQRLCELGHERAYLTTSNARLPATRLYLQFGFIPLIRDEEEKAAWRKFL